MILQYYILSFIYVPPFFYTFKSNMRFHHPGLSVAYLLWHGLQFKLSNMSISLILIAIISLIVIAGTVYLLVSKNQQLGQAKKSNILLIVGIVIFVSFIVTSLKHPAVHRRKTSSGEGYDLQSIFFPKDCKYTEERKYSNSIQISNDVIDEVHARNYLPISKRPHNQDNNEHQAENILFLSNKDEGASDFLSELAEKKCKQNHPILYFKLKQSVKNDKQFVKIVGFNSYQQFQDSVCSLSGVQVKKTENGVEYIEASKSNRSPFIIIDNFQHLINTLSTQIHSQSYSYIDQQNQNSVNTKEYTTKQRLITLILSKLMKKCKVSIVLNSQSQKAVQDLLFIWQQSLKTSQKDLFPLQFHEWQGLKRYDVYKIIIKAIPNSDYILNKLLEGSKKEQYTYNDLNNIVSEIQRTISINNQEKNVFKRQDNTLRQASIKISVAKYFDLGKAYKQIRSSQNKSISFLKQKVPLMELWKLQERNLISIRNGNVYIQ